MSLPIYQLCIEDSVDDQTGIYAVSMVTDPAIERNFIALNKDITQHLHLNKSNKQILTGAVLLPNQLIYRYSEQLGGYYTTFSSEEIEKVSYKMMRTGIALHNTTHQHQAPLSDNYLIELWIIQDPENDKANALGFSNLPKGTLMCSYKIEDQKYWQEEVLTGNVKGFSIEGLFKQYPINFSKTNKPNNNTKMNDNKEKVSLKQKVEAYFNRVFAMFEDQRFTLENGSEVVVEDDQTVRFSENNEVVSDGEHALQDGRLLIVNNGKLVEIKEVVDAAKQDFSKIELNKIRVKFEEEVSVVKRDFKDVLQGMRAVVTELVDRIDELERISTDAKEVSETTKEELSKYADKTPSTRPSSDLQQKFSSSDPYLDRINQSVKLQNAK